jgi:hypothetical protein
MSGCYRCGLPEGSDARLCETCFSHRFNHGEVVVPYESDQSAEGPEFTPCMKRWLLSSGVVLYLAVVSVGLLVQGERLELRRNVPQRDFLSFGANDFPVQHETELAFLSGPLGDRAIEYSK